MFQVDKFLDIGFSKYSCFKKNWIFEYNKLYNISILQKALKGPDVNFDYDLVQEVIFKPRAIAIEPKAIDDKPSFSYGWPSNAWRL